MKRFTFLPMLAGIGWAFSLPLSADYKPRADAAVTKWLYLALRNISAQWPKPPADWVSAARRFGMQFDVRFFGPRLAEDQKM